MVIRNIIGSLLLIFLIVAYSFSYAMEDNASSDTQPHDDTAKSSNSYREKYEEFKKMKMKDIMPI